MTFCDMSYFEKIKDICLKYMERNYDYCYLIAMHEKNRVEGADSIIVGSSHAMNGIIEKELDQAGDVIQFSISSQDIYYDMLHIKKALSEAKRPIKRCYINLGYYMLHQDISKSETLQPIVTRTYLNLFGEEYCHHLLNAKAIDLFEKIDIDPEVYPEESIRELAAFWGKKVLYEQSSYYGNLLVRENNNMLGLKKVEWNSISEEDKIAYARHRTVDGHNKHIKHVETRKENGEFLSEIVKLLCDNNIKPIFFITPYTKCYNDLIEPAYKPDILDALEKLEWPVEFLDMNDYEDLFDDTDFIDSDHLNLKGAHKATSLLNEFTAIVEGKE